MGSCRLLIVDDEPKIASILRQVGEGCGYEVSATISASAFKAAYADAAPNVIMLDLAVPGTDGIALMRWLADAGCTAKILIVSALGETVSKSAKQLGQAFSLNMAGIISKPFRIAELREQLNRLFDCPPPAEISDRRIGVAATNVQPLSNSSSNFAASSIFR